jgi:hypothetical protein
MLHLEYRRNLNELYGAYGHNLTYDEMKWLADWCFVRGQNLLIPHAFFYSVRGPRFDERPPDVGPHSGWWPEFKAFADGCRRMSWLNTDSKQVCDAVILTDEVFLPDKPAKSLYQHQVDFNYLETRLLGNEARVNSNGIIIAGMKYGTVVLDTLGYIPESAVKLLKNLARHRHLIINSNSKYASWFKGALVYSTYDEMIVAVNRISSPDIELTVPSEGIRLRHVIKENGDYYILFNEGESDVSTGINVSAKGGRPPSGEHHWIDPETATVSGTGENDQVIFKTHELKILWVPGKK